MIYKNIEIHNVEETEVLEGRDGVGFCRVPKEVRKTLECGEQAQRMSVNSTGVEFRFVMKSDVVKLRLQKRYLGEHGLHYMHVFYGDIQGGWWDQNRYLEDDAFEIVIEKPKNQEVLEAYSKLTNGGFSSDVVRVILDGGSYLLLDVVGEVEPPKKEQLPQKTLLTYGSSITHGSNSLNRSYSWTALLAAHLKTDLRNLGMAGSCAMEKDMVDFLADLGVNGGWDVATLELGINVVWWENEKIYERVKYTISQIAGKNPEKKVYVVSPFYCDDDFFHLGNATRWRTLIPEIIKELSLPNVEYIDGLDCIDSAAYLSADEVHPNIYGVQKIYETLEKRVRL